MKRYLIPKFWPLPRKGKIFTVAPMPGPHPKYRCIPLLVVLRDVLGYAETNPEARKIISSGKVFVDKKVRRDPKFPVGLMDVLEIPELKESYRVVIEKKGLSLRKIKQEEADRKLCRIEGKKIIKKGRVQLNLMDGRNILAEKQGEYRPGDSVLIHLPDQKIIRHYRLAKGSPAFIINGKNIGVSGVIKDVKRRKTMLEKSTVILKSDGKELETLVEYIMPGELAELGKVKQTKPAKQEKKLKKEKGR